ncbi:MAG TPA: DUF2334 domain-containing protein [Candidatus Eisenbergiella merdipullorum]|uniref:DUF2334 domain-containing protein n=1 Tax=Candidatus Eisenbergiella merdipullorum TaxID=2838553 RepID=A0A9D2I334_9FIRM|nr:DUF2334 domain-containing protein [Candidatus Eisenbergiella merdipullorum]
MKIALRMDDITADMNWDNFFRLKELFDKAGIRPLLGVVPDNRDTSLSCMQERADFWELLLELQEDGWSIAQHGCRHVYTTKKGGLFPLNHFSEFAGLPFERQKKLIAYGKRILEDRGVETDIFMAPGHSYDKNTLRALKECGFAYVTDGFGSAPYRRDGLTFLPIARKRSACFSGGEGYTTLVIHANGMNDAEIDWYAGMLAEHAGDFVSYGRLLELPAEERDFAGNLSEYVQASGKCLAVRALSVLRMK